MPCVITMSCILFGCTPDPRLHVLGTSLHPCRGLDFIGALACKVRAYVDAGEHLEREESDDGETPAVVPP